VPVGLPFILNSTPPGGVSRHWRNSNSVRGTTARVLVASAAVILALAMPRFASAEGQSVDSPSSVTLRATLWLQADSGEVLERIRGQTNDVQVELLVDSFDPMPSDLDAQLRTAYAIGEKQNASLVIWFVRQADGERHFVVNVAIPKTRRLFTRDLGQSVANLDNVGLSSAVKESAALVVRASIQAVLSGWTIGEVRVAGPVEATTPQPAAAIAKEIRAAEVPVQLPPSNSPRVVIRELPWAIGAEWLAVYDGPKGHPIAECASLRAERREQRVKAFMTGGWCGSREVDNAHGAIRIGRQQAGLGASVILLHSGIEASLGAQAGVVVYERNTVEELPGFHAIASPATHVIGRIGPEFRLLVPASGSQLQAGFVVGVDFLSNSLKIGYRVYDVSPVPVSPQFDQVAQFGIVQPYVTLGLTWRL